jgi:hypothetical protein
VLKKKKKKVLTMIKSYDIIISKKEKGKEK